MYAGLFLLPWVTLYGTTAFLFNHPGLLRHQELPWPSYFVDRTAVLGTGNDLEAVARRLLTALATSPAWHGETAPTLVAGSANGFLTFRAQKGDEQSTLRYDVANDTLAVAPWGASQPLTARAFFTSLHTTHEYPDTFSARTVWAVFVDGMATLMLYWATSGLIMWWQYRALRRAGALVLAASASTGAILAVSLYHLAATAR